MLSQSTHTCLTKTSVLLHKTIILSNFCLHSFVFLTDLFQVQTNMFSHFLWGKKKKNPFLTSCSGSSNRRMWQKMSWKMRFFSLLCLCSLVLWWEAALRGTSSCCFMPSTRKTTSSLTNLLSKKHSSRRWRCSQITHAAEFLFFPN